MAQLKNGFVSDTPCPRCDCQVVKEFSCGCGDMHAHHCENCGRYTAPTLKPDQHVGELSFLTQPCKLGAVLHRHHPTPGEFMAGVPSKEEFLVGVLIG
jgi:hypothetical protein